MCEAHLDVDKVNVYTSYNSLPLTCEKCEEFLNENGKYSYPVFVSFVVNELFTVRSQLSMYYLVIKGTTCLFCVL